MRTPLTGPAPTFIPTYSYIFLALDPYTYSYSDTQTVTHQSSCASELRLGPNFAL